MESVINVCMYVILYSSLWKLINTIMHCCINIKEIKEFERHQRLVGSRKKVAWNYHQFSVKYESLQDEMQVGPIYVKYFLDVEGMRSSIIHIYVYTYKCACLFI